MIAIDVAKAVSERIKLFKRNDGRVVTQGDHVGRIMPSLFSRVALLSWKKDVILSHEKQEQGHTGRQTDVVLSSRKEMPQITGSRTWEKDLAVAVET